MIPAESATVADGRKRTDGYVMDREERGIPDNPADFHRRRFSRDSISGGSGSARAVFLFHKAVEDTVGSDAPPLGMSQLRVSLSHVFTHRCRLPELEGSMIAFLGRIASV